MDYSADFHRQLLQLEDQLLVGTGSDHAWTANHSLSGDCDSESNVHLRDLIPQFSSISAESFTTVQCSHGDGEKFAEILEEEASVSVSSPKIADSLNAHSSIENFRKNSHRCCCSKIRPTVDISSGKSLLPETSNSLEFDRCLPLASSHQWQHARTTCRLTKTLRLGPEITTQAKQQKPTRAAPKKARVEPRASCPPLKIRKEKLGDRIAALQQLVAPFGKTDTASVLMEAINYIKFLQNQVQMLTHSYVKSYRSRNYKTMCRGESNEEPERDLKAQGLCLVPLTCISDLPENIGSGGAGGIWAPLMNFNRRTF